MRASTKGVVVQSGANDQHETVPRCRDQITPTKGDLAGGKSLGFANQGEASMNEGMSRQAMTRIERDGSGETKHGSLGIDAMNDSEMKHPMLETSQRSLLVLQ
jgi:hypothetical protein